MKYPFVLFAALLSVLFFPNCATVPISGRQQANLSGNRMLNKSAAAEYRRLIAHSRLSDDVAQVQLVRRVANKVIAAASRYYVRNGMSKQFNEFQWEINLIDNPTVNAFCWPGGKIAVFSGILDMAENEDQLAAVIGHEIGHALAHHAREKRSHGIIADIGQVGVQVATANKSTEVRQVADAGYVVGTTLGFMLPFSRAMEKEADQIGLRLMIMAGYDPQEAVRFWEKNIEKFGDAKTAFFHTHPTHRARRKELLEQIPQAIAFATPYLDNSSEQPESAPVMATAEPISISPNDVQKSTALPTQAMPFLSATPKENYITVQVETVVNYAIGRDEYKSLESLGQIHIEQALIEGSKYERVLLGYFKDESQAQVALKAVRQKGFTKAYLVEYKDGKRGKWVN